MNVVVWQLRQCGRAVGVAGLVGLALLAGALVVQVGLVRSTAEAIRAQHTRLAALRVAAAERAAEPAAMPAHPLAALPPTGTASQQLGELERLARSHGLALPRGQYSVGPVTGTPLQRWQLVLPVVADYPALHAFLAAALERWPNLTLDELKLRRERIESSELQAELRLSLFVEATP